MAENNKTDWQARKIGALWSHKSGTGKKYMTGEVTINGKPTKVVVFKNIHKKDPSDKGPDLNIYLSENQDAPKPQKAKVAVAAVKVNTEADDLI